MPKTDCGFTTIPGGAAGKDLLAFYGPTIFVDIGFDPAFSPARLAIPPAPGMTGSRFHV